ncbi:glycosyltransferase [Erwiniaceae bacterium BAC15a-03b]|uniref:Glycosyltransferase n=1 Tax=Winslowiella arboricola TaxID=2978220 RepID=A0A9J6PKK4_9GAMM|nr:glycosyltransferase [Winslowiella arboricola]MCU5774294.1 glycosyltransferase [Winslowiella arboricola]MCU5778841.1 glycosyltransferase [Winslowiella arboricola]
MTNVIALVVTFKRKDLLEKVLNSLLNQTHSLSKIVVIDNNSNDGTVELVKSVINSYPDKLEYFNTGGNLGGAGGFAFGFEKMAGRDYDHLWLMDDDLLPSDNCLENLLNCSQGDIVQPLRKNIDGSIAELSPLKFDLNDFFAILPKKGTVQSLLKEQPYIKGPISIDGVPFEGPLIKKAVVDAVGIPEKRFFIFYDDMDYSLRAKKKGFQIFCATEAMATRLLVNNQKNDLSSWKGYFMLRNLFRLYFTHSVKKSAYVKPFIIAGGYLIYSLIRLRFSEVRVVFDALKDSFTFKTDDKYIP